MLSFTAFPVCSCQVECCVELGKGRMEVSDEGKEKKRKEEKERVGKGKHKSISNSEQKTTTHFC